MPKLKQTRIPIKDFIPSPLPSTMKKHKKLTTKAAPRKAGLSARLLKKIKEREDELKDIQEGTRLWREWWEKMGLEPNPEFRPDLYYKVHGKPPPILFPTSEDEEDSIPWANHFNSWAILQKKPSSLP